MLFRNKKDNDLNKGKYLGIGGKIEKDESITEALKREVKEETNLELVEFKYLGIVNFINDSYKEVMHLFTSNNYRGKLGKCDEGDLIWVKKNDIFNLNLWEGDKIFLERMLNNNNDFFVLNLYYSKNILKKSEFI